MPDPTRNLDEIVLRHPVPADAEPWARFLAREQARTYDGLVPADFEATAYAEVDPEATALLFADPGPWRLRVAEHGGRIVGVAAAGDAPASWEIEMGLVPAPAARELSRLYVSPDWQGTGLADLLFGAVMDDRPHYLWLISANDRAGRFYERRGFRHLDETFAAGGRWGGIPMHRMLRD